MVFIALLNCIIDKVEVRLNVRWYGLGEYSWKLIDLKLLLQEQAALPFSHGPK